MTSNASFLFCFQDQSLFCSMRRKLGTNEIYLSKKNFRNMETCFSWFLALPLPSYFLVSGSAICLLVGLFINLPIQFPLPFLPIFFPCISSSRFVPDYSTGFGGKYGVQKDRVDQVGVNTALFTNFTLLTNTGFAKHDYM